MPHFTFYFSCPSKALIRGLLLLSVIATDEVLGSKSVSQVEGGKNLTSSTSHNIVDMADSGQGHSSVDKPTRLLLGLLLVLQICHFLLFSDLPSVVLVSAHIKF